MRASLNPSTRATKSAIYFCDKDFHMNVAQP